MAIVDLASDYLGDLRCVDTLRQMHLYERALAVVAKLGGAPGARALEVRVRRGARDYVAAESLLPPVDDDDVAMRENRIAILHRLRRVDEIADLCRRDDHDRLVDGDEKRGYRILVAVARALATQPDPQLVIRRFVTAKDREPAEGAPAHSWLLNLYLRYGMSPQARALAREMAREGQHYLRRASAGRALARIGDTDLAIETLRSVIDEHRAYYGARRRLITVLRDIGDFAGAHRVLVDAQSIQIRLPALSTHRAVAAKTVGNKSKAAVAGDTETLALAEHPLLHVEHGLLYLAQFDGSNPATLDQAMRRVAQVGNGGEARWVQARIVRARNDDDTIPTLAKMAAENHPGRDPVAVQYGHACAEAQRWDEAIAAYSAVIQADAGNREAYLGLLTVRALRTDPRQDALLPDPGSQSQVIDESGLAAAVIGIRDTLAPDVPILCMAAERLAQNGHYGYAQQLFDAALAINPDHDLSYAGKIRSWSWARRFDRAQEVCDEARNRWGTGSVPFTVELAIAMMRADQGQLYAATGAFDRLAGNLELDAIDERNREHFGASAVWLATSLRWLNRHERAESVIARALRPAQRGNGEMESSYFSRACDLYDELGWNWFERHDFGRAADNFRKALEIDPRHAGSLRGMIQVHRALGDVARAERWASRAFRLHPLEPSLRCELAWLYGEMNDFDRAGTLLDQALAREIAHAPALEWQIIYLIRERRLVEAEAAATRSILLRPEYPSIIEAACSVPLRDRDPRRAELIAEQAQNARPDDVRLLLVAALVQDQIGADGDRFADLCKKLGSPSLDGNPDAVAAHARMTRHVQSPTADQLDRLSRQTPWGIPSEMLAERAELMLRLGRVEQALAALAQLHRDIPWSRRITRQLAIAMANHGKLDEALVVVDNAVDRARAGGDPRPVELLVLRGEIQLYASRFEQARGDAYEALAHPTRHCIETRILQTAVHMALGDLDYAVELARALHRRRPASRRVQLCLAKALELVGERREAAAVLGDMEYMLAHDRPAIIAGSWILRSIGQAGRAERIMARARVAMPHDPDIEAEHAWTWLDQGRVDKARQVFHRLITRTDAGKDAALGHAGLGWCELRASRPNLSKALASFRAAIDSDHRLAEAHVGACISLILDANQSTKRPERSTRLIHALPHAEAALAIEPVAANEQLVGRLWYRIGAYTKAYEHLQRSVRLHPYRCDRAALGLLQTSQGDPDGAITTLVDGLKMLNSGASITGNETLSDPTSTSLRVDLLAALGAAHLDRDHLNGSAGTDTHTGVAYLDEATRLAPNHLFAIYHLALGLARLGSARKAENVLRGTLNRVTPHARWRSTRAVHLVGIDKEDVTRLRQCLAEILLQRVDRPGGRRAKAESDRLLKQVAYDTGETNTNLDVHPNNGSRLRRIGLALAGLFAAAGAALWGGWLLAPAGSRIRQIDDTTMLGFTGLAVLAIFAGVTLPRLVRLKIGSVELTTTAIELSATITAVDLPTQVPLGIGFGTIDPTRIQWTKSWSSDTRVPRLGPTAGTIISRHYAQRDQFMPWRRV